MENNTLSFLVNLNIDDLKAKADEGKRRFEELGKRAEQEGHKIDDIFKSLGAGKDFEDRLSALRNEMETCEDKIVTSLKNIKKWEEDAKRAFAAGDLGAWNDSNKDIVDAQKNVAELSARIEYLRTLYDTLRKSAGEAFAEPAKTNRLFVSEDEYNQVKQMEEELENLKQKRAELADNDDLAGDERTKQLVAINAQIIELQQQLSAANQKATEAASALGDNLGTKAADSSARLYELNATLKGQQETYDKLVAKLEDVAQEMDAATTAGDVSKLKDLQLEYQHLAEQVENANNALSETKGQQQDASESWSEMLDTIASLGKGVEQSTRPVGQAITSFTQLSAAFKNSKNPVQTFRATLQALRGGMSLTQISVKGVISGLKALWKALLSNPITAILVAITALVAAFVSIANSIKSVAEKQAQLNAAEKVHLDLLKQITENSDRGYDQAIQAKERELKILKAGNSSLSAQYKLEDEILRLKKEKAEKAKELWKEETVNIDQTNKALERQQKALAALELRSSDGGDLTWKQVNRRMAEQGMNVEYRRSGFLGWGRKELYVDGVRVSKGATEDMIKDVQGQLDNSKAKVEMGVKVEADVEDAQAAIEEAARQRAEKYKQIAKTETDAIRAATGANNALISDAYQREIAVAITASSNKIADLKRRLSEEADLTARARLAINQQILAEEKSLQQKLQTLEMAHQAKLLAIRRQVEDVGVDSGAKTADEQRSALLQKYSRLYEDTITKIDTGRTNGTLSEDEITELYNLAMAYRKRYNAESAILDLQIQQDEIETEKETINLRLAAVREGTMEELQLRLQLIELERRAALAANKALAADRQQSEVDINAKFDKQQRDLLKSQLEQYLTYEQRRQKIAAEYADRREALYQHDANGNRVKDSDGNDVFIEGAGQGNIDELNRQQSEDIQGLLLEFSEMLATTDQEYAVWLAHLDDVTTKGLRNMLATAKKQLATLTDPADIERYEAIIAELEEKLKNIHLSPEEEDYEQWKAEAEVISECASKVENLGNSMGGATGKALTLVGSVTKSIITTKTVIRDIHKAAETAMKGIEDTSSKTAKAIKAAEDASVILAIVWAIMEALKMVQEIVDGLSEWAEAQDIQWLQDILSVVQDIFAVITNPIGTLFSGLPSAAKKHKEKLEDIDDEIDELGKSYDTLERQAAKTFGVSNAEIRRQQIELKKAQIELLNTAIAEEKAQKNPDDDAIKEWQNQIDQLNNEIEDLGEAAVDAIWGEDISSAITSFSDALSNAWENNTSAAQASNDAIRDMIKKRIRQELLDEIQKEEKLQAIRDRIDEAFADGIITETELAEIEALGEQAAAELEEKYGAIYRMLNADAEKDRSATVRGIATASQESVDELNGRMTSVQSHTFSINESMNIVRDNVVAILGSVQRIEYNTEELHSLRNDLHGLKDTIEIQGVRIRN